MREARELSELAISGIAWGRTGFGIGVAFLGRILHGSFGLFLDGSTIGSAFGGFALNPVVSRRLGNHLDAADMMKPGPSVG